MENGERTSPLISSRQFARSTLGTLNAVSMRKKSSLGVMSGVMPAMSRLGVDANERSCGGKVATGEGRVALVAATRALPEPPDDKALAPTATTAVPAAAIPVQRRNDRRVPTTLRLLGGIGSSVVVGSSMGSFNSVGDPPQRLG
jgi:hypothetical protein